MASALSRTPFSCSKDSSAFVFSRRSVFCFALFSTSASWFSSSFFFAWSCLMIVRKSETSNTGSSSSSDSSATLSSAGSSDTSFSSSIVSAVSSAFTSSMVSSAASSFASSTVSATSSAFTSSIASSFTSSITSEDSVASAASFSAVSGSASSISATNSAYFFPICRYCASISFSNSRICLFRPVISIVSCTLVSTTVFTLFADAAMFSPTSCTFFKALSKNPMISTPVLLCVNAHRSC